MKEESKMEKLDIHMIALDLALRQSFIKIIYHLQSTWEKLLGCDI